MPAIAFVGDSERKEEEEGTDERLKEYIRSNTSTTEMTNSLLIAFLIESARSYHWNSLMIPSQKKGTRKNDSRFNEWFSIFDFP